uniref:Alternative protein SPRED1 n=1 Tax=Homo sapiens TaxID=9606 RepID=L8EBE5_HUMAN|nr:alternative protein SPRED1 [Homo sapiens]
MVNVLAAYTARKGLIMKKMLGENVRMLQTLLKDAYIKLVACSVQRACCIIVCQTQREIFLIPVRVTLATTSSACDG